MATLATASPAKLIVDYLRNRLSLTGWGLFVGIMPATPDKAIAILDSGGFEGIPNLLVDYPSIQVRVRGAQAPLNKDGYTEAYLKAREVRDHILGMSNAPTEFTELDGCTERGHLISLGYDDNKRPNFSNNFQLIVEPLSNSITHRESL